MVKWSALRLLSSGFDLWQGHMMMGQMQRKNFAYWHLNFFSYRKTALQDAHFGKSSETNVILQLE